MEPYEAREIAAQAWCDNSTSHLDMIPELAEAFAKILVDEVGKASLREQVEFWQKEAAGRRDDMANYTRIVSETIDRLNVEVSKLTKERDEYKSGFEAAASKYRNLKLQMQEIINVC